MALPFISNLPYVAEQFTTPSLSARVDGAPFKLTGKTRPFAASRDAILNVAVDGLPLASFLSLAPFKMAASLDTEVDLDANLTVTFQQDSKGSNLHTQGQAA